MESNSTPSNTNFWPFSSDSSLLHKLSFVFPLTPFEPDCKVTFKLNCKPKPIPPLRAPETISKFVNVTGNPSKLLSGLANPIFPLSKYGLYEKNFKFSKLMPLKFTFFRLPIAFSRLSTPVKLATASNFPAVSLSSIFEVGYKSNFTFEQLISTESLGCTENRYLSFLSPVIFEITPL